MTIYLQGVRDVLLGATACCVLLYALMVFIVFARPDVVVGLVLRESNLDSTWNERGDWHVRVDTARLALLRLRWVFLLGLAGIAFSGGVFIMCLRLGVPG